MFAITVIFLCADLLFLMALQKIYHLIPAKELKRRARTGDKVARTFYSVVAFGPSLDLFLWLCIGLLSSILFVLLAVNLPWPFAVLACLILVWVGFAWTPLSRVSKYTLQAAEFVTPAVHWILEHGQPLLVRLAALIDRYLHLNVHTGLYTNEDIIDLIDRQKVQSDNRITAQELYIVKHALKFGDKTVADVMTPRRMVKMVSPDDTIGPILMGELHKSGHSRFPVETKDKGIVGTLYMRDMLRAKEGGIVKSVMRPDVFYVNETKELAHVLDAFVKTKHHLFMVVNEFEEIVGVITIEDVLEQIIGKHIVDEFDQYEDLRAVAQVQAEKDREKHPTVVESQEEKQPEKEEKKPDAKNAE